MTLSASAWQSRRFGHWLRCCTHSPLTPSSPLAPAYPLQLPCPLKLASLSGQFFLFPGEFQVLLKLQDSICVCVGLIPTPSLYNPLHIPYVTPFYSLTYSCVIPLPLTMGCPFLGVEGTLAGSQRNPSQRLLPSPQQVVSSGPSLPRLL
jgi:hypothetical protein